MPSQKVRIQFDLPFERVEEIESIMKAAGINTRKDYFNNALTLLEWAIKEVRTGNSIVSIDEKNKRYKELVMPIFQNSSKSNR